LKVMATGVAAGAAAAADPGAGAAPVAVSRASICPAADVQAPAATVRAASGRRLRTRVHMIVS
jgi:hypothetical protein